MYCTGLNCTLYNAAVITVLDCTVLYIMLLWWLNCTELYSIECFCSAGPYSICFYLRLKEKKQNKRWSAHGSELGFWWLYYPPQAHQDNRILMALLSSPSTSGQQDSDGSTILPKHIRPTGGGDIGIQVTLWEEKQCSGQYHDILPEKGTACQ